MSPRCTVCAACVFHGRTLSFVLPELHLFGSPLAVRGTHPFPFFHPECRGCRDSGGLSTHKVKKTQSRIV